MKIVFQERAWDDDLYWQKADPKLLLRLNALIMECTRSSFRGTGKPEPLRGAMSDWWSRRLNHEHRLVYRAEGDNLLIAQCRYHY